MVRDRCLYQAFQNIFTLGREFKADPSAFTQPRQTLPASQHLWSCCFPANQMWQLLAQRTACFNPLPLSAIPVHNRAKALTPGFPILFSGQNRGPSLSGLAGQGMSAFQNCKPLHCAEQESTFWVLVLSLGKLSIMQTADLVKHLFQA